MVSNDFYWFGQQTAYWSGSGPEAEIIFVSTDTAYQGDTGSAIRLFSAGRSETIFFESGACTSKDLCTSEGIYQQAPGQDALFLENTIRPVFSPDGTWYTFINPEAITAENNGNIQYFLMQDPNRGLISRKVFYLPGRPGFRVYPDVRTVAFSPQSDALFIYYDVYSNYFEKSLRFETYVLDLNTNILLEYGEMPGNSGSFRPKLVWSPDGQKVLLFLTDIVDETRYSLSIYETILQTEERLVPVDENIINNSNYFYITNIGWQAP